MHAIRFKLVGANTSINHIPTRATEYSAGMDLRSTINAIIPPGGRVSLPTGIALEIPRGMEGQIRSKSGLARNHGIVVLNAPGTIDSDYRGEIMVLLYNTSANAFTVRSGDMIAQIVFAQYVNVPLICATQLEDTVRGDKGFGDMDIHNDSHGFAKNPHNE